jgi:hypothetical protein
VFGVLTQVKAQYLSAHMYYFSKSYVLEVKKNLLKCHCVSFLYLSMQAVPLLRHFVLHWRPFRGIFSVQSTSSRRFCVYVAALRKLALRHKGISMKYSDHSAVKEHTDHGSQLYGPRIHFGEHPKHRHEVTNVCGRFLTGIKGANISHKC